MEFVLLSEFTDSGGEVLPMASIFFHWEHLLWMLNGLVRQQFCKFRF